MSLPRGQKLKKLIDAWVPGTVVTTTWLGAHGISPQNTQKYVKSGWLVSVGRGTFKRPRETVGWPGAIYALQRQLDVPVHVGGLTALELAGYAHYARLGESPVHLFSPPNIALPRWFETHWGEGVRLFRSKILPADVGLTEQSVSTGLELRTATIERAALEILHLAPRQFGLVEAAQIIEGLRTLRPKLMQQLLEECASIKVRRLFLYLAERADLPVSRHLAPDRINLGSGDRSLTNGGLYVAKYRLSLPRELVDARME